MLAGGFDDFIEEGSYEFANMKATSNSVKEFAAGREPTEFSRPTTSTRAGVSFGFSSDCSDHSLYALSSSWRAKAVVYMLS